MKVASKIATGSGITIVLLVAVLIYDLSLVQRLTSINKNLSEIGLAATTTTLEQSRLLTRMDEFTRKEYVTSDKAYSKGLDELYATFGDELDQLRRLGLSDEERDLAERLSSTWAFYLHQVSDRGTSDDTTELSANPERHAALLRSIADLQDRVDEIGVAAQASMASQAEKAAAASARALQFSLIAAGLAVVVSILILWLTVRAIKTPLTRLTEGTHAVSGGEFSYRLDSSGNDEFSKLAGSFNDMVEQLGDAERVKKEFLSHVSHELKSPLASIEETTELLLDEIPGPLSEKQARFLGLNLESGRRLSVMISRLLDLSRLEAGVMEYEFRRHDLGSMLRSVADEFEARARERGVRIDFTDSQEKVLIECDRDRFYQVIENLLDNALKVSPPNETIVLRIRPDEMSTETVVIEVVDHGPGVAEEYKEKIFERFYQGPGGERRGSGRGVGLGLSISREIMQAHRGAVSVRDNGESGCIFSISVPRARSDGDSQWSAVGRVASQPATI